MPPLRPRAFEGLEAKVQFLSFQSPSGFSEHLLQVFLNSWRGSCGGWG